MAHDEPVEIYTELRDRALAVTADDPGAHAADASLLAVVMDTGYPEAVATLIGLADGTTSLYFSNGGGVIGGGEHERVADATRRWMRLAEGAVDQMAPQTETPLPEVGMTQFIVTTKDGRLGAIAQEAELGSGRHRLSDLFFAAHDVITEVRRIEEQGRTR